MPPLPRVATAALSATLTGVGRARRPRLRGRLQLDGLDGPVEVIRDRWGVPHIYAGRVTDLLFAQGFIHAQDRLWQMDFQRRLVAGRLAEVLGPQPLALDRGVRLLGLYRVAEVEVGLMSDQGRAELEAYSAGVNQYMARQPLPIEFALLRYRPGPWRPADSLCWGKMLSWGLSANWETELLRARLIEVLGHGRAAELEPLMPGPTVMGGVVMGAARQPRPARQHRAAGTQEDVLLGQDEPELPSTQGTPGSNNWVLAGSRTASGKPLLANDMHLPITAPAIWYENHLVSTASEDPVDVTGVTFPGIPYVLAGHNERVAWGFTNGYPDVQDLFIEHLRRTPEVVEYEYRGEWRRAEVRHEQIQVKGGETENLEVIVTGHGPIINLLAPGLTSPPGPDGLPGQPLALRWTSFDPHPMIETIRGMNRASSCDEFREALRAWVAPVQNVVYADVQGNIGYVYPGRVPVRPKGDGRVPAPGWTGEYDWTGWIPFEELPQQSNPAQGFIVSANNRVTDDSYPYYLSREFAMGDRAERIITLIESKPKLLLSDMRAMQLDQEATSLRRMARFLATLEVDEPELRALVTLVKDWDGQLSADSPAAALCEIFGRLVQRVVMEVKLREDEGASGEDPALVERVLGRGPAPGIEEFTSFYQRMWEWLYTTLEVPESHWWDLGQGETRDDVLRTALRRTYNYLSSRLGEPELPDCQNWAWGRLHMVTFGHVAGRVPALAGHFGRGPYPLGGDFNTVFATGGGLTAEASTAVIGPPFRLIADLSDLSRCYALLAPGNSGRPDSPHYDDQVEAWFRGKYHPMLYSRQDVERGARQRLVLTPRQPPQEKRTRGEKQRRRQARRPISGLEKHAGDEQAAGEHGPG